MSNFDAFSTTTISDSRTFTSQTAPAPATKSGSDPLKTRFPSSRPLPKELRDEAQGMSWDLFTATFAPTPMTRITFTGEEKANWCYNSYRADVTEMSKTFPPRTAQHEVTASGPAHAFAQMLGDANRYVEILDFHQWEIHEATFTAIKVAHQINERHTAWAIGFGATPQASIAAAMSSAAQRIYG